MAEANFPTPNPKLVIQKLLSWPPPAPPTLDNTVSRFRPGRQPL